MSISSQRAIATLFILAFVSAAGVVGIDYLQIGQKSPDLVPPEEQADLIRVDKASRTLTLLRGANAIRIYRISLGPVPAGHKSEEGDGRTPEGRYSIDSRNSRSHFHLALHISYPNKGDRIDAERRGVSPGSDIMIHGLPNGLSWLGRLHLKRDWTNGCIAVTNQEMDDLWSHVATGVEVRIYP